MPVETINHWLDQERQLGSPNPESIILATASAKGVVHSRVVAIREISELGVLFFTQKGTRKVADLTENPSASMTLWLPLQQREVVLDGVMQTLTNDENASYWRTLPRDRQIRFATYAISPGKPIQSLNILDTWRDTLAETYRDQEIPMTDCYCGYRLVPEMMYFYTLGVEGFSEVMRYSRTEQGWDAQLISP